MKDEIICLFYVDRMHLQEQSFYSTQSRYEGHDIWQATFLRRIIKFYSFRIMLLGPWVSVQCIAMYFWTRYLRYRVPKNEYVVVVLPIYLQYTHSLLTILGNGTILFWLCWLCSIEQYCCILTELYDFYEFNDLNSNIFQMQTLTLNMTEYLSIHSNSWNIIVHSQKICLFNIFNSHEAPKATNCEYFNILRVSTEHL